MDEVLCSMFDVENEKVAIIVHLKRAGQICLAVGSEQRRWRRRRQIRSASSPAAAGRWKTLATTSCCYHIFKLNFLAGKRNIYDTC